MKNYMPILFLISVCFGQDKLILKKGAVYEGKFLGLESNKIHFSVPNTPNFPLKRLNDIKELSQNGKVLIQNGKILVDMDELSIEQSNEDKITSEPIKTKTQNLQRQQTNTVNKFSGLLISAGGFLLASSYQDLSELDSIEEIEEKSDSARLRAQAGGALIGLGGFLLFLDK